MDETVATEIPWWLVVVELEALPSWLALPRDRRRAVVEEQVAPVLRAHREVRVRWVDVESFSAGCSDLLLAETTELLSWNRLFEGLRDTAVSTVPYFQASRILAGIPDGHRDYERHAAAMDAGGTSDVATGGKAR